MYRDTVTLFNRAKSGLTTTWYPTVIRGVDFNSSLSSMDARYGTDSADLASLHIRYTVESSEIIVANKRVILPREWDAMTAGFDSAICFRTGEDFDFVLVGEYPETAVTDTAFGIDGFYDYMNANYDNVFRLASVAKFSVIPHYEISLR